ncbi:50S ribosomal protein L29 [miscellaneous Crenarchaeota group-15 archaeon DG-45]|uniref:Large ribosomal subunit protein uL29 n=1 Tax=miscellaneous Crenarchaeota group-15 archaeon DG-45 TaxID=1685127 RepID=A0A0M0BSG4_9ARCH|nr:MAG: 50S ribosomal protein L29 [miscellaneous Crenarchaeota group-15 archaeon DG-45]
MPIMRMREIREMAPEERMRRLGELRTELSRLRAMVSAGGSVENPGRVKALRRTIARMLTVMREEELER